MGFVTYLTIMQRSFRTTALASVCLLSFSGAACASQALDVIQAPALVDGGGGQGRAGTGP